MSTAWARARAMRCEPTRIAATSAVLTPSTTTRGPVPSADSPSRAALSVALEQLRTLGELRDAGYVTDDEFERIKRRILEETL